MNKNKLKMAIKQNATKLLDESIGKTFSDINLTNVVSSVSQSNRNKSKNKLVGPNQTDKLLPSKGNRKENKKAAYRMGENSFK